jgi:hypothetical protein
LVVSWQGRTYNPDTYPVRAQIFQPDGTKIGGQFFVSERNHHSTIDALASGGFVFTWSTGRGVSGQILDSAGSKVGNAFQIATYSSGVVRLPTVTALDDGRFAAAWIDQPMEIGNGSDPSEVMVQLFDSARQKLGSQLQVSTDLPGVTGEQHDPTITSLPGGRLLVAWTDSNETTILFGGPSDYNRGIVGQLFDVGDDVVITSGSGKRRGSVCGRRGAGPCHRDHRDR